MLVKINNSTMEFEDEIDKLKNRFNVGTSSGAALNAILKFDELENYYLEEIELRKQLEADLYELKSLLKEKVSIENQIRRFIDLS